MAFCPIEIVSAISPPCVLILKISFHSFSDQKPRGSVDFLHLFMDHIKANTIDDYIAQFDPAIQERLEQMRETICKAAPDAVEAISYAMPTFKLNGNLVHFAGYKNHIGFYPAPDGIEAFKKEISKYVWAKGSVQFPHDKPLPLALVTRIVKFRVQQNKDKKKK